MTHPDTNMDAWLVRQVQPEMQNGKVFIEVAGQRRELNVMQIIVIARNWQRALAHVAINDTLKALKGKADGDTADTAKTEEGQRTLDAPDTVYARGTFAAGDQAEAAAIATTVESAEQGVSITRPERTPYEWPAETPKDMLLGNGTSSGLIATPDAIKPLVMMPVIDEDQEPELPFPYNAVS